MKRKLIRQGHNTMTMTLPIGWVRRLKLNNKDEVDVAEHPDYLIVRAGEHRDEPKSITLDFSNLTVPMVWRFFQSAYREGFDEIRVIFDPKKRFYENVYHYYTTQFAYSHLGEKKPQQPPVDMLQDLVNRFLGIEIMEVKENCCIIRDIGTPTSQEFSTSLRRIFFLITGIFDRVMKALKENETGNLNICKELHTMDLSVDRFIDYCCRILNKVRDSAPAKNKPAIFSSLFLLELLGDEFKYIGTHLAKPGRNLDKLLSFAQKVKDHFKLYEKLFFSFSNDLAAEIGRNDFTIYHEHFKWKEKTRGEIKSIARHFMQISKFVFCLTELRIEMELAGIISQNRELLNGFNGRKQE